MSAYTDQDATARYFEKTQQQGKLPLGTSMSHSQALLAMSK
jgi:hypothetical protein